MPPDPLAPGSGSGSRFAPPPERSSAEPFIVDEGEYGTEPQPEPQPGSEAREEAGRVASNTADRTRELAASAKEEASVVADTVKEEGGRVVGSAKEEAGQVIDEARHQTRRIMDEGVDELKHQAGMGQQRIAEVVRSMSEELRSMTDPATESGPVVEFAGRLQQYGQDASGWLEETSPEDVLDSVRRFAARRPWAFLAISAGVGFVGARLARSLSESGDSQPTRSSGAGRHLDAPSYSDDDQRLARGASSVGGAPLAADVRSQQQSLPGESNGTSRDEDVRGGGLS